LNYITNTSKCIEKTFKYFGVFQSLKDELSLRGNKPVWVAPLDLTLFLEF
jgi:hypothetical protein